MKLQGAIIGLGNIAFGSHLPAYLHHGDAVEIVSGCDRSLENQEHFLKLVPRAKTYTDFHDLFAKHPLDFVSICTPPNSHYEIIREAVKHEVAVLCEKPLCTGIGELQQIIKLLREAGLPFMPCHQYRYASQWKKLTSMIDQGMIGRVLHAHFEVFRKEPNPGNRHWRSNWRTLREKSGGGIIQDHGTHLFYLAESLLGKPVKIGARLNCFLHDHDGLEDSAWISSVHENGVAKFDITWASFQRRINYRILGDLGEILLNEKEICYIDKNGKSSIIEMDSFSGNSLHKDWFDTLIGLFLNQVREKRPDMDWLKEAAGGFIFSQIAYLSSREEREIETQAIFQDPDYPDYSLSLYKFLFS
ncbi:MAG: Gfo/Idh/MocA family protein [bacterium]